MVMAPSNSNGVSMAKYSSLRLHTTSEVRPRPVRNANRGSNRNSGLNTHQMTEATTTRIPIMRKTIFIVSPLDRKCYVPRVKQSGTRVYNQSYTDNHIETEERDKPRYARHISYIVLRYSKNIQIPIRKYIIPPYQDNSFTFQVRDTPGEKTIICTIIQPNDPEFTLLCLKKVVPDISLKITVSHEALWGYDKKIIRVE